MIRRRVVVHGSVQGVNFRAGALRRAEELGVAGWVRNCSDGSVEAVAEGPEEAVEQFCTWCESGPAAASVEDVQVSGESADDEQGFHVR